MRRRSPHLPPASDCTITRADGSVEVVPALGAVTYANATRPRKDLAEQARARDGGRCRYCWAPSGKVAFVLARSLGGKNATANMVVTCRTCDNQLGPDRTPRALDKHPEALRPRAQAVN